MTNSDNTLVLQRKITFCSKAGLPEILRCLGSTGPQSALFCNVHMLMLSQDDEDLAAAMQNADYVFADGVPVAWLQKRITKLQNRVVRGYEVLLELCQSAQRQAHPVGFFGGAPDVLKSLVEQLHIRFPTLEVAYAHAPPFQPGLIHSSADEVATINSAQLRYLFVGLGCPKQEKWILEHAGQLNCSTLGVGAAFDWIAGTTAMPPAWMERSSLGWLFRLFQDPRRMWRRYLAFNTRFVFSAIKVLYNNKQTNQDRHGHK